MVDRGRGRRGGWGAVAGEQGAKHSLKLFSAGGPKRNIASFALKSNINNKNNNKNHNNDNYYSTTDNDYYKKEQRRKHYTTILKQKQKRI